MQMIFTGGPKKKKTNVYSQSNPTVNIGNEKLEIVDQYVCLGHILSFGKEHLANFGLHLVNWMTF